MQNEIMVSVHMLCYNHEKYVAQALDSVLMQETNFNYEIVIGDDASSDRSQEIIKEYCDKYPNKIHAILRKNNIGANNNNIDVMKKCKGKYIAGLECDDFWTDPHKLQKQVDFLENNPEYSMCFTSVNVIRDSAFVPPYEKKDIDGLREYLNKGRGLLEMPSATLCFRNLFKNNRNYLYYFTKSDIIGDRILHTLLLKHGKAKYLPEQTATYRYMRHSSNSFSSLNSICRMKDTVKAFNVCMCISGKKYYNLWYQNLSIIYSWLIKATNENDGKVAALKVFLFDMNIIHKFYYLRYLIYSSK